MLTIPRCACDVPAHNYTWSFEPKVDWSATYASSKEIFHYFDTFARKHHLHHYVKTRHQVDGAYWNAQKGGYDVKILNLEDGSQVEDWCDILVNAGGILNNWQWPAIPGLENYKGTLLHTANWDDNVRLEGRHVGLIGNGYVLCLGLLTAFADAPQLFRHPSATDYTTDRFPLYDLHPRTDMGISRTRS